MRCYIVRFRKEQEEDVNKVYKEANFVKGKSYVAVENNGSVIISDENNKDWTFRIDDEYNLIIQYPSARDFFSTVDIFNCESEEGLNCIKEGVSEVPIESAIFIFAGKVLVIEPPKSEMPFVLSKDKK